MNGRLEREDGIAYRSYGPGRDGGASLAEWRDAQRGRKHSPARPWRAAAEVGAVWLLLCWFTSMIVRGSGTGAWELAGFMVAIVGVAGWVRGGGYKR